MMIICSPLPPPVPVLLEHPHVLGRHNWVADLSRVVKLWYKYFDSLTYRSYTGDYIGKFTFHTGVRNDVPGGGGGDGKDWGKMFLHQSTARKKVL